MKYLFVFFLVLAGCGGDENPPAELNYSGTMHVNGWKGVPNISSQTITHDSHDFVIFKAEGSAGISALHSPACRKCNPQPVEEK